MKNCKLILFICIGIGVVSGLVFVLIRYMDKLTEIFGELKRYLHRLEVVSPSRSATIDLAQAEDTKAFEESIYTPTEE